MRSSSRHCKRTRPHACAFHLRQPPSLVRRYWLAARLFCCAPANPALAAGDRAMGLQSLPVAFGVDTAKWICVASIDATQVCIAVVKAATSNSHTVEIQLVCGGPPTPPAVLRALEPPKQRSSCPPSALRPLACHMLTN